MIYYHTEDFFNICKTLFLLANLVKKIWKFDKNLNSADKEKLPNIKKAFYSKSLLYDNRKNIILFICKKLTLSKKRFTPHIPYKLCIH